MGRNNLALKRYIHSIGDALPCSMRMKKQIISQIRKSIVDYLQENSKADFATVQAHFGTPQEIATSYVNEQDASMLLKKMGIKKKILVVVIGVITAIFLTWIGFAALVAIDARVMTEGRVGVSVEMD